MNLKSTSAWFAALSLAIALTTAAPVQAQVGLVGVASGSYRGLTAPNPVLRFSYLVFGYGNGSADGLAIWRGPDSTIVWRVTSVMSVEFTPGTTSQAFAGPIVAIFGTPPPGFAVGATAYTASNDDPDGTASLDVVPPPALVLAQLTALIGSTAAAQVMAQVGNLSTIQQIVLLAQLVPFIPGPTFTPLLDGNIWIRP